MLTPLDIENREFKKTLNGYNRDDVEDFMSLILVDYEKLYKESLANKEKIEALNASVLGYKQQETTLQNAIMAAQQAADALKATANEQADLIVREAKSKAAQIIRDANDEIKQLEGRYRELNQQIESYKMRVGAIIKSQLEILEDLRPEKMAVATEAAPAAQDTLDEDVKTFSLNHN
ncbi:MAG: DivIVA domain-containing protein [Clostridia bacterium]|nr:DivIVA domain-containing protein [Clostridia bacterium]